MERFSCKNILVDNQHPCDMISVSVQDSVLVLARIFQGEMVRASCKIVLVGNQHPFYRVSVSAQASVLVLDSISYKDSKGRDVRRLLLADNQHPFYKPRKSYN